MPWRQRRVRHDLTEALRALNLDAAAYLPGTMAFWTDRGQVLGVPVSESPWGVIWRPDVFAAAGIAAPDANWTFNEFLDACSAVQGLAKSGRMRGLRAALSPISPQIIPAPQLPFAGTLALEGLWQAFARGFGGSIAADNRFTLTEAKTVAGNRTLCELAKQYCIAAEGLSALAVAKTGLKTFAAWLDAMFARVGMGFWLYGDGLPTSVKWARLPRFPIQPVIPVVSSAVVLEASGAPLPAAGSSEALAAAEFGSWLDSSRAAPIMAAAGIPPATANPAVQNAFWSGTGPGPAAVVGDWKNFRDVYSGFPVIPPRDYVASALGEALAGKLTVANALAKAQRQLGDAALGGSTASVPPTSANGFESLVGSARAARARRRPSCPSEAIPQRIWGLLPLAPRPSAGGGGGPDLPPVWAMGQGGEPGASRRGRLRATEGAPASRGHPWDRF